MYAHGRHAASAIYGLKKAGDDGEEKHRGIKPLVAGLAGLGLGGAAYAGLRRFRPNAIPELRALQDKAKNLKFQVATSNDTGRKARSFLFGARDVPHIAPKGEPVVDTGKALLHHTPANVARKGSVNVNTGDLPGALDDKWIFHQLMTQGTGGGAGLANSVPPTHRLDRALKEVGGDPAKLIRLMGEKGFVIKPRTGSMSKAEDLLTDATPLHHQRMREALKNPESFIIQEKLPIKREFRVHTVNNVPVTATHRQLPHEGLRAFWNKHMGGGGGAFVPALGDQRKKLMDFARQSTKHVGVAPEGNNILGDTENLHQALDIAELHDGTYRLIESNPTPGTFMNPVVNRKVQQAVTGRLPKDVAAAGAVGAGTVGAVGAGKLLSSDEGDDA